MLIVFGRDLAALTKIISGLVVAHALVIHNVVRTVLTDSLNTFIRILEPGLKAFDKKYDIVLPKNYKHGNEYESKIMEDLGYKLISLFEEIYNYKATPEIQKLVDFKEFEKWYDIHRKRISAKATENAAKKAA